MRQLVLGSQHRWQTYLSILQSRLVAGGLVVEPLGRLRVHVSQKQLLHQVIQVVLQMLLFHPQQLQLVHGKVELPGAVEAVLLAPQPVDAVRLPGALHSPFAAAVEALAELFGHGGGVADYLNTVEVVLCLCAATDDPGGLAQPQSTPDDQGVGGFGAVVVLIVELVSLEGVVGVEAVGTCEELRSWSHLTTATDEHLGKTSLPRKRLEAARMILQTAALLLDQHQRGQSEL